jgi:hypothetical protein
LVTGKLDPRRLKPDEPSIGDRVASRKRVTTGSPEETTLLRTELRALDGEITCLEQWTPHVRLASVAPAAKDAGRGVANRRHRESA